MVTQQADSVSHTFETLWVFDFDLITQLITRIETTSDVFRHMLALGHLDAESFFSMNVVGPHASVAKELLLGQIGPQWQSEPISSSQLSLEQVAKDMIDLIFPISPDAVAIDPQMFNHQLAQVFTTSALVIDPLAPSLIISWNAQFENADENSDTFGLLGVFKGFEVTRTFSISSWATCWRAVR